MKNITILLAFVAILYSCKRKYDSPPIKTIGDGQLTNTKALKQNYSGTPDTIREDIYLTGIIVADESNGNLYKSVYLNDAFGGIELRLSFSGGLYQGDSVRISLQNLIFQQYNGSFQIGDIDPSESVVKLKNNCAVPVAYKTINQLSVLDQGKIIELNDVEFKDLDKGQLYADALNKQSLNRMLTDCFGNEIIVRSSGYSTIANQTTPNGNGKFQGLLTVYNSDLQLIIVNLNELELNNPSCYNNTVSLCDPVNQVAESFALVQDNTDFQMNCWQNFATKGNRKWQGEIFNTDNYLKATAYGSTDSENETFVISPVLTYSGQNLSFKSASAYYTHDGLSVLISQNFNGSINDATWTEINCTLAGASNANYEWIPSGSINLSSYITNNNPFVIAFKYQGNGTSNTGTYAIDDILIQ